MKNFSVKWAVREHVNGPGDHDGGVREGDVTVVASGEVVKASESAVALRAELTEALEQGFPRLALGPTYNIDRSYDIDINEVT